MLNWLFGPRNVQKHLIFSMKIRQKRLEKGRIETTKTSHTRFSSLKPPHLVCMDASHCTNVHLAPQFYKKLLTIKML